MPAIAQQLPPRFPCWCRAVYSWGGETKKDLGFIEGDLIECLNAGDGSWWMGRLKRDRRMVGLFPSNFVEVLEDYQPTPISRSVSPLPISSGTVSRGGSDASQKPAPAQKSRSVFRKPFQAYNEVGPKGTVAQLKTPEKKGSLSKHRPYSSMKTMAAPNSRATSPSPTKQQGLVLQPVARGSHSSLSRAPSPAPSTYRAASPNPYADYRAASPAPSHYRATSPNPYQDQRAPSPAPSQFRAISPAPFSQDHFISRGPSPAPFEESESSPPPPAPPPHRSTYNLAPQQYQPYNPQNAYDHQSQSPIPPSPGRQGHTPSPLRDAMNDVMSSLQDMAVDRRSPAPGGGSSTPPNMWSPEAFDHFHASQRNARSHTSQGISHHQANPSEDIANQEEDFGSQRYYSGGDGPPQVSDYVERMESRLRQLHQQEDAEREPPGPTPPLKDGVFKRPSIPTTNYSQPQHAPHERKLKNRRSAYELGRSALNRTLTGKSSATTSSTGQSTSTNSSHSTQQTSASLMSGYSASGFSATSAGSLARRKFGVGSIKRPKSSLEERIAAFEGGGKDRPITPFSGVTFHSSHKSQSNLADDGVLTNDLTTGVSDSGNGNVLLGGLSAPKAKKSGFFKKMIDSARTGAASARSTIGSASRPTSTSPDKKSMLGFGSSSSRPSTSAGNRSAALDMGLGPSIQGGRDTAGGGAASAMGLGGGGDWMQVRRDVNRSNSLSANERQERVERCMMQDQPSFAPADVLLQTAEGDEGLDGLPVAYPTDFNDANVRKNLELVDKSARFVNSVPPATNAAGLAQGFVCRPYRSDVQRLRAVFTWVAEKVTWEEDFEFREEEGIDTRRVIHARRGCSEEIAMLVAEMCSAVGIHAEVVHGLLKKPGEALGMALENFHHAETDGRGNHYWNAVIVDGEWRIMDASLAGPTNPRRGEFSSQNGPAAESWWFLSKPTEVCYTHIPIVPEQQHIVPPIAPDVLLALPCACPSYFRNGLQMQDFDTSLLHLENLEMAQICIVVEEGVECIAEVEVRQFVRDADGEFFVESGDGVTKRALAQPEWKSGIKRFVVKALLPGDEGEAVLKVYAGKKGLMHSIKSNPHPLALALPISHTGKNPPYDFVLRHPTPHAQRHDLYIAQPQCARLAVNNTFVFAVRQHPSSLPNQSSNGNGGNLMEDGLSRVGTPNPYARPTSAMSMMSASISNTGSSYSNPSSNASSESARQKDKPAKLAIQSPSGKIIRLTRKQESISRGRRGDDEEGLGSTWETVIKIGERGTWRALVLADRTARWCVFGEWECF
ncbi:MAG: cytokinesis protein 3 [Bogoriella megaspora]|nr:MAG: cytokinesis protein 3 [Bogoriella megaspora]